MPKIIFLGTGASSCRDLRDNTSLLLIYRKKPFLIDAGGSICYKLTRLGIKFYTLKDIIITHLHPDHIYGLVSLVHSQGYLNSALKIYTHKRSIKFIRKLLRLFKLTASPYPRIKFIDVFSKKYFYIDKNLKIEAFKTLHTPESFGIIIWYKSKKVVYSSDTAFFEKMMKIYKGASILIHESTSYRSYFQKHTRLYKMHTSSFQLSLLASKVKPKILIPIHFLGMSKKSVSRIIEELYKHYPYKIVVPQDFSRIDF